MQMQVQRLKRKGLRKLLTASERERERRREERDNRDKREIGRDRTDREGSWASLGSAAPRNLESREKCSLPGRMDGIGLALIARKEGKLGSQGRRRRPMPSAQDAPKVGVF